jgi:hypothetical protein
MGKRHLPASLCEVQEWKARRARLGRIAVQGVLRGVHAIRVLAPSCERKALPWSVNMKSPHQERSRAFSEELDLRYLELLKAKAPYEQCTRELLNLEKRWLRQAKTLSQRLAVQRIIASTLLTEAYSRRMPWREFGRWLRRLEHLGFPDLGSRVHAVCLYIQALSLFPRRARGAWEMFEDMERRVRRLRQNNPLREEHLEAIAHARKVARVPRPEPLRAQGSAVVGRRPRSLETGR